MLMKNMVVVTPKEKKFFGADAIRFLSTQLPRMWPLRWLMHIPGTMPLWRWGYRRFANRRYLFGKRQTCDDGSCRIS
jgi:predicted DCC family thiol-disulfide oxidoreductase YuxK